MIIAVRGGTKVSISMQKTAVTRNFFCVTAVFFY